MLEAWNLVNARFRLNQLSNDFFCALTQFESRVFGMTIVGTPRARRVSRVDLCMLLISQIVKYGFMGYGN